MGEGDWLPRNAMTPEHRRREISELLHAMSQPLTTLCCSLELSSYQNWTAEQYREGAAQALEQASRLSRLLAGVRQLWEAEDPGERKQVVWLDTAIAETVQDLLPVAREREVTMSCCCGACLPVMAEPRRMRQALLYLAESTLNQAQRGTECRITADLHEGAALLQLTIYAAREHHPGEQSQGASSKRTEEMTSQIHLPLMIARRIFEAAGGSFQILRDGHHLSFGVRLPLCANVPPCDGTEQARNFSPADKPRR